MPPFRFGFADVFLAPRMALGAKKLWLQLRGVISAALFNGVFSYLALLVSGQDVYRYWSTYYLFPPAAALLDGVTLTRLGYVFWATGLLGGVIILGLSMTAVAKVAVEQLRGNDFFSSREAGAYVRRHWRSVVFGPVAVLVAILGLGACAFLVGLIGKIPWAGDVAASLTFLPLVAAAITALFLAVVFVVSLLLSPAVTAATGDDAFETAFELFSTVSGQPWRLAVYEITSAAVTAASAVFAGVWATLAIVGTRGVLIITAGEKAGTAFAAALRVIPTWLRGAYAGSCPPLAWISAYTAGVGSLAAAAPIPLSWPQAIAATFYSLVLLVVLALVAAYALNVHTCAQTNIYVILRKKKDDENLLEMYDEELENTLLEFKGDRPQTGTSP